MRNIRDKKFKQPIFVELEGCEKKLDISNLLNEITFVAGNSKDFEEALAYVKHQANEAMLDLPQYIDLADGGGEAFFKYDYFFLNSLNKAISGLELI
jgi:hypothetical protein